MMKRVFIAGVDGYLGWSLAQYLGAQGYVVSGMDNWQRRDRWVPECGSASAIPIATPKDRIAAFKTFFGDHHFEHVGDNAYGDVAAFPMICKALEAFKPDCFVNLAQMPAAPYSMKDVYHAQGTYQNNIGTTLAPLWVFKEHLPEVPIITIGTAGEYGTPGIKISEGDIEIENDGRKAMLPFPKLPASFYHAAKVASTVIVDRACVWWGLAATDVMQGVVYGTRHEHMSRDQDMATRFDFDAVLGTAINRFVAQAIIDYPMTVYGAGTQIRGFLPLRDSMRCLQLLIDNPPEPGKVRIVNQYDQTYSILELAQAVQRVAAEFDISAKIQHIKNPRWELEEHFYEMERAQLVQLGYEPKGELESELREMFEDLIPHKARLERFVSAVLPTVSWHRG